MPPRRARLLTASMALFLLAALPPGVGAAEAETPAPPATPPEAEPAAPAPAPAPAAPSVAPVAAPADAPAPMAEDLVVTATRGPRPARDVPAAVTVLPRAEIDRSPAKTADELLMTVPSFNLFRRSSSVAADPSSQGTSLRGVGPSAASRSLVLVDGIPANDPFGDWVYWRAISPLSIQRIEVVPGGSSALYGNYAMAGVTQVISRPITPRTLDAVAEYGSFRTSRVGAFASDRMGPLGIALDGDLFDSSGYPAVAAAQRGPIDTDAPSRHALLNARLEGEASRDLSLLARAGYFFENYNGGTRFTTAMVRQLQYAAGARYAVGEGGSLELDLFGHQGDFKQDRGRTTTPPRATEFFSAHQDVPTTDLGGGLLWRGRPLRLAGSHALTAGLDARWMRGETHEDLLPAVVGPASVLHQDAAGEQRLYGIFAQDVWEVSEAVEVDLALRYDRWDNVAGSRSQLLGDGTTTPTRFPSRSADAVDPKLGVRVRPLEWLSLRAAGYQAFRSPTLNELYRSFQVGQIRTLGNENLEAERLVGAEAGVDLAPSRALSLRATAFWNEMKNPITNVTLPAPATNLRQKQNLGKARIQGVETSADWRLSRHWLVAAAYTYVDATVTEAPGQEQLVGKQLAEDPRHRASFSLSWDDPRFLTASAQVRYLGKQYDDDLNQVPLGEAALVDLFASYHFVRGFDLFLAVSNLLDKSYLVGNAAVQTVGQPRFVHGGVRVRLGE